MKVILDYVWIMIVRSRTNLLHRPPLAPRITRIFTWWYLFISFTVRMIKKNIFIWRYLKVITKSWTDNSASGENIDAILTMIARTMSPAIAVRVPREISLSNRSLYFHAITWYWCSNVQILDHLAYVQMPGSFFTQPPKSWIRKGGRTSKILLSLHTHIIKMANVCCTDSWTRTPRQQNHQGIESLILVLLPEWTTITYVHFECCSPRKAFCIWYNI